MKKNSRSSWAPEKNLENFSLVIGVSTDFSERLFVWIKQSMSTSADHVVIPSHLLVKTRRFECSATLCTSLLFFYVDMSWSAPEDWSRWDPERLLVCPYDEVHMIKAKKFQQHLLKCRKNHPDKDFVNCPFNAKHVMLRSEIRHHVSRCPDRVSGINTVWYGHILVRFFGV